MSQHDVYMSIIAVRQALIREGYSQGEIISRMRRAVAEADKMLYERRPSSGGFMLPPSCTPAELTAILEVEGLSLRKVERIQEHLSLSAEVVLLRALAAPIEAEELARQEAEDAKLEAARRLIKELGGI